MSRTLNLLLFLFWIILGASCESHDYMDYSNTCLIPGIPYYHMHNKDEVLQCCPGYAGPITKCLPVCSECGPNAFCQAPEQCACIDDDYEKIENDKGCKPKAAENRWLPFSANNSQVPIETTSATTPEDPNLCTRELDTLRPVPPEWMSIKEAFDTFGITFPIDMFKEIETFCCPGYAKDESEQLCKPVCQPDCGPNSYCQAPNKCACHKGFTQSADSDLCVPECSEQTKPAHSTCLTPAIWACDEGYIKLPNKNGEKGYGCYPHCVHSCSSYGRCVAPNVCECLPGYTPIPIGHDAANDLSLSICQKK